MFKFSTALPLASMQESQSIPNKAGSRIDGEGPAIVLLHSSMGSKSQWRALMERMRGTNRLIAIDLHGYGDTAMPACAHRYSLADEVRLVQSMLAQVLGPREGYHLVGHSFGGGVALRLAHAEPERVKSLCLYEPTAFHLLDPRHPALGEIRTVARTTEAALQRGDHAGGAEVFIDYWSGAGTFAVLPPSRQELFAALLPKVPLDFRALVDEPLRASDYCRIGVPCCLIAGRRSPACVRVIASILHEALAECEVHQIDAGHMGPLTHPAVVNAIIEKFVRHIDARSEIYSA